MGKMLTSKKLNDDNAFKLKISEREQIIFSNPLTSKLITVIKPFEKDWKKQVVAMQEKVYSERFCPYKRVPKKQTNCITWRDSFGKIIDRLEKLRQEILSVEATECVIEILENDNQVVVYSHNDDPGVDLTKFYVNLGSVQVFESQCFYQPIYIFKLF